MQFLGRFYHALEQKGRLSVPASFRSNLGDTAILTTGLDGCLFLFPESYWQEVTDEATDMPLTKKTSRDWTRYLANNATTVSFDRLGRILIPDYLRDKAKLTKNVVVVGSLKRIEIWDQDSYHTYLKELEQKAEEIAESLPVKETHE